MNMILDKEVEIWLNSRNIPYYEWLWYLLPKHKDSKWRIAVAKWTKIKVKVEDLSSSSKVKVLCQCEDCWNIRSVSYDTLIYRENSRYLITWETLCVLCSNHRTKWESNPNYKHWCNKYSEYRRNAKRRWYEFNLSVDEFKKIISQKCYYCWSNGKVWIDRLSPKIWYSIENCVPCCRLCNRTKATMNYEEFVLYIKTLYNNLIRNEIQE